MPGHARAKQGRARVDGGARVAIRLLARYLIEIERPERAARAILVLHADRNGRLRVFAERANAIYVSEGGGHVQGTPVVFHSGLRLEKIDRGTLLMSSLTEMK
jgi:hypothetical protein